MATCIHGVRLGVDIAERCTWCALEQGRAARLDNINRLRELIVLYGQRRRDVGAFGGINSEQARKAVREASTEAAKVFDEIERILAALREMTRPAVPPRPLPILDPEQGAGPDDPGRKERYACATCGVFVELVPAKFPGDPEQGWRHKGLPASDVRPHVVRPQSLG